MKGKSLTYEERFYIEKRLSEGVRQVRIASELQRSRATISREVRRNNDPSFGGFYSARRADNLANQRRSQSQPDNRFCRLSDEVKSFIREELEKHTSPESICGVLPRKFNVHFSKNSLYRYLHQERQSGGKLYALLPHHGKRYKYQSGQPKYSPIPDRTGIEHRPAEADLKQVPGHFEIDTVFGKDQKSFLLTLVDKHTKQVIIRKLPNKQAETVAAAFEDIVANTFCEFKTLTSDNGSEFAAHKKITKITGAPVYFARPYHSWERGLNEHTNGLIRRFYPKGTDFNLVSDEDIARLEHILNTRWRKSLGFYSPNEIFLAYLQAA